MSSIIDRVPRLRNRAFFLSDALLLSASAALAFKARYEGPWGSDIRELVLLFVVSSVLLKLLALIGLGLYRRLWRYASVSDVEILLFAAGTCAIIDAALGLFLLPTLGFTPTRLPYAVVLLSACLGAIVITLPRLGLRLLARRDRRSRQRGHRRAIVVGAGVAGGMIVKELVENPQLGINPVAVLDDDPSKHRLRLHNVPVLGLPRRGAQARAPDGGERVRSGAE